MYWLFIIAALFIIFAYFMWYIFDTAFYNPPRKRNRSVDLGEQYRVLKDGLDKTRKEVREARYEAVDTVSFDGTVLKGKYYHFNDGAPVEIIFHGYRSNPLNDCGGGFSLTREYGCNVLLPDHRAHGESGGNVITFGVKERYDCLQWIKYLIERFGDIKIIISGVSMGASTVLMASDLELPENVKGIIADCGYSSPKEIILQESGKMGFPPKLSAPFIKLSAKLLAGFDWEETSAVKAVKNSKLPILIIHGEDDRFVPCSMSHQIYEACTSHKKLLTVKDAGHGLSFLVAPEKYKKAVNDFKDAVLNDDMNYFE